MLKPLLLAELMSGAVAAQADTGTPLTLPALDADLRADPGGAPFVLLFPSVQTWVGVPFQLVATAAGNTSFIDGLLDIPVGVFGVTAAYTLINSGFGLFGTKKGSVEFFGTTAHHKVDLVQGQNIRDCLNNVFNNVIDGVNAVPAFTSGAVRMDQQTFNLPAAFASESLVSIRSTGLNLGNPGGVAFITAAPVAVATPVPGPDNALLLISGGLAGLAWRRRTCA